MWDSIVYVLFMEDVNSLILKGSLTPPTNHCHTTLFKNDTRSISVALKVCFHNTSSNLYPKCGPHSFQSKYRCAIWLKCSKSDDTGLFNATLHSKKKGTKTVPLVV